MKKIYLIRHAKSDWGNSNLRDHDRPLNERGISNAKAMADFASRKLEKPQLIMTSTAKRAEATAQYFINAFAGLSFGVQEKSELYHSTEEEILNILSLVDDEINTVYLFAHNPGLTFFANEINTNIYIDNVATTGILDINYAGDSWLDISFDSLKLIDYYYPKMF
ncbi:MAG TPA: histidine phosphatase family protein [Saprospiraceae bacterium]|nr:histidine phosphatase family protein [Saprospiraceae bacterium]HRX28546.1 histidine phosphatase family protein [Saprospiraceae bacterium]